MTFEEVARSALAAVDCDASYVLAAQWAAERYQQLCSRLRFRHMRVIGRLTTPAVYDTGTVTIARGGEVVTGVATAWTNALEGRFIRFSVNWYKILKVASATSMTLDQPLSEASVTAGTYKIVSRQIPVDAEARWLSTAIVHTRLRRPLDLISLPEFDAKYPERQLVGPPPVIWCQTEDAINADGAKCFAIEVYPYPTEAEMLNYVYWKEPPLMKPEEEVPRVIDGYQLKEGTLINVMQYNASMYAKPGPKFSLEAAAYWRNEFRQQSTTWERIILDVGKQDRGVDDLTFILQTTRSHMNWYASGIHNAHDEVYSRGRRP